MSRVGFVGGSYADQCPNADNEFTMNCYPEAVEGQGVSAMRLQPAHGLKLFAQIGGTSNRGQCTINGRDFTVVGPNFIEVFANKTTSVLQNVAQDLNPVSMVAGLGGNAGKVLICSAGQLYALDLATNGWTVVDMTQFSGALISEVDYIDGFFIALQENSNIFWTSNLLDPTTWPGLNVTEVSEFPDNLTTFKVIHERIFNQGLKQSIPYYDAGLSPGAPFAVDESAAVIEQGSGSKWSKVILDNTLFFIGQDARGAGIAWRMNGYSPQRVSGHAQEWAWSQYPAGVTDAIAYSWQDQGHSFWTIYFPSGNATWVYDVATQLWSQLGQWNGVSYSAHPSQNHVFCFGKHLVGDNSSGNIYEMAIPKLNGNSWDFATFNGAPIRGCRRSPHITNELQWISHKFVQVNLESGLGPQPPLKDGRNFPRDPVITLRFSDDGGHTWSMPRDRGIGQAGKFLKRVFWDRLGTARQRQYELSWSDPVPVRIVDFYLLATGYQSQQRIAEQLRKVS
jgi:hypothetical protein